MIYPTRRAVIAALAGAPLALVVGLAQPQLWIAAPAWAIALIALGLLDALLAPPPHRLTVEFAPPDYMAIATPGAARLGLTFTGSNRWPSQLEAALAAEPRLGLVKPTGSPDPERRGFLFPFMPTRRGTARFGQAIIRWQGPFGLIWRQAKRPLNAEGPITADIRRIEDESIAFLSRDAMHGAKVQRDIGEGAEFHALREFHSGMDRRTVDWKQSARHQKLLAKEFRTERNHQVVMALDSGRVMCEPIGDAPRIDRAIHGALILSYACLRSGDRAGLFAFDDRPRLSTGAVTSIGAFPLLVRQAGRIDYSTAETNYAFGLTTLSASLKRRSLIVVFTEFADATAAELMLETTANLMKRHLVLFVVMRDDELEALVTHAPDTPEDVARAVVAAGLLRERDLVLARLRRMGAHIVEAPADRVGPEALNAYLELKRRDLL